MKIAFPEFRNWTILLTALKTFNRTIEQGLLIFAWPYLNEGKIRRSFIPSKCLVEKLNQKATDGRGIFWLIPHFCHADAISSLNSEIKINALYRPLRNSVLDDYLRKSRERFGIRTIDRKDGGMFKTLKVLRKGEILAMLFDQNAGGAGTRIEFMGRECSCTTLPDILFDKFNPKVIFVYSRRIGFWKSSIEVEEMGKLKADELVIEKGNRWLDNKLRTDPILRESWLWMHQRWKPGAGQPRKGRIR